MKEYTPTSVGIALMTKEFTNAKNKLNARVVKAIKKVLSGMEYEACPLTDIFYKDDEGVNRVVTAVKLVPVEKYGLVTTERNVVLITEAVGVSPECSAPCSIRLEDTAFDPIQILGTIGLVVERMELES